MNNAELEGIHHNAKKRDKSTHTNTQPHTLKYVHTHMQKCTLTRNGRKQNQMGVQKVLSLPVGMLHNTIIV